MGKWVIISFCKVGTFHPFHSSSISSFFPVRSNGCKEGVTDQVYTLVQSRTERRRVSSSSSSSSSSFSSSSFHQFLSSHTRTHTHMTTMHRTKVSFKKEMKNIRRKKKKSLCVCALLFLRDDIRKYSMEKSQKLNNGKEKGHILKEISLSQYYFFWSPCVVLPPLKKREEREEREEKAKITCVKESVDEKRLWKRHKDSLHDSKAGRGVQCNSSNR